MINIGLLLGSFDPPHIGHVYAASYALNNGMDEVWVVPAWRNPTKTNQTEWEHRYNMCKLAFSELDNTRIETFDSIWQTNYTYEGLEKLLNLNNLPSSYRDINYYIIGGTDIALEIPQWKHGDWILDNFGVIEVPRVGVTNEKTEIGIECSSTAIRNMIKERKSPYPFISKLLYDYCNHNNLYVK